MTAPSTWALERIIGAAADLHARPLEPGTGRRVELLQPTAPALVLGSTQPEATVDLAALAATGVQLVRRRSGGGAVLLLPERTTWIDVTIPRDDALWLDDVARAFHWLGAAWAKALELLGIRADVHTGPGRETPWSRRICFAGLGSGEVVVSGRKLVGISQRRTRDGARFQCVVHRGWDPVPILGLLAVDDLERAYGIAELAAVATGLELPPDALLAALVSALPE